MTFASGASSQQPAKQQSEAQKREGNGQSPVEPSGNQLGFGRVHPTARTEHPILLPFSTKSTSRHGNAPVVDSAQPAVRLSLCGVEEKLSLCFSF
jgi:hypothetical protein